VWSVGVLLRLTPSRTEGTAQAVELASLTGLTACRLGGKITPGAARVLPPLHQPPLIVEEDLNFSLRTCETFNVLNDGMSITGAMVGEKHSPT
jgi:hypothetical protein